MKRIVWVLLFFAASAWPDELPDRVAIQRTIEALNDIDRTDEGQKRIAGLFTNDADNQLNSLSDLDRLLLPSDEPLSEVTKPRILVRSIRFITSDVALVDAANTQYGSTILVRRVLVLLIMKREASGWRIASLRILVDLGGLR